MLRDPAAGPALEKALRDSDKDVVAEAVLGVGLVGNTAARPVVEEIFRTNSSGFIKGRALESLALLHDRASIPLFESLLANKDDNYRELSAEGLARVKYEGAKDWQVRYEQERSPNVRNALAYGLAASGDVDYINHMANSLDSRQSDQAEVYLFELGKYNGQLNEMYRYLRSTNPKVRAGMPKVIGRIGDPSSADKVRPLTEDSSTEVAREAVATLRKLSR
jgi:HEAT repeat protein